MQPLYIPGVAMYTTRRTNEWIFGGLLAAQALVILIIEA